MLLDPSWMNTELLQATNVTYFGFSLGRMSLFLWNRPQKITILGA